MGKRRRFCFFPFPMVFLLMSACLLLSGCQFLYMVQKYSTDSSTQPVTTVEVYQPYEFVTQEMMSKHLNAKPAKPDLPEGQWYDAPPFWVQLKNPSLGHYTLRFFTKDVPNITRLDKPGSIDIQAFTIRGSKAWTQRHPMIFEPLTIGGQTYDVATFELDVSPLPLSRLETKVQMQFPVKLQSKSVYASQVGKKLTVHKELLAIQKLSDFETVIYHEGSPELFFGLTGFNENQEALIPIQSEKITTKKHRTRYEYAYDQKLDHIDLHVASAVMKPRKNMTLNADLFYYQLDSYVVTFENAPSSFTRKVTPARSTLKTQQYAIKIEKKMLVINKRSYGKIPAKSWIHISHNEVRVNEKLVLPQ